VQAVKAFRALKLCSWDGHGRVPLLRARWLQRSCMVRGDVVDRLCLCDLTSVVPMHACWRLESCTARVVLTHSAACGLCALGAAHQPELSSLLEASSSSSSLKFVFVARTCR
jgi:hypothetical protein